MNALATPFADPGIRPYAIVGDVMHPSLRTGDFLMVRPVDRYDYDGIYILDGGGVYRAEVRIGSGNVMIWRDNPAYERWEIPLDQFNDLVTAKAVAEVKMREPLHRLTAH